MLLPDNIFFFFSMIWQVSDSDCHLFAIVSSLALATPWLEELQGPPEGLKRKGGGGERADDGALGAYY